MKLWRKASAILKDQSSIFLTNLSRRTAFQNSELEIAIVRATSHDETIVDYTNAKRVFAWIHTSPSFLRSLIWILSKRMEKTRNWVVALKGLMLMHGIFCCQIPAVQKIRRLPFDFSNFIDGHSKDTKTWGFSAFVRAYFAFLDHRCVLLSCDSLLQQTENEERSDSMVQVLVELQQWQALLDKLMDLRPYTKSMNVGLILEAMDCIIIEIFDVYSRICNGIAGVPVGIVAAGKVDAAMALCVLKKAALQGEELASYFEFCRGIGVKNASELPRVEQIPEQHIQDLERILYGVSEKRITGNLNFHEEKAVGMKETNQPMEAQKDSNKFLRTIVEDNWVIFDDEVQVNGGGGFSGVEQINCTNPFEDSLHVPSLQCGVIFTH